MLEYMNLRIFLGYLEGILMRYYLNMKSGRIHKPITQIKVFFDAIEESELQDLLCKGDPYTWCNKRKWSYSIYSHLYRFL